MSIYSGNGHFKHMKPFEFPSGPRLLFGANTIDQLGSLAKEFSAGRVLIVTDPGIRKAGHAERAIASLQQSSIDVLVFDGVDENPSTGHVNAGVQFVTKLEPVQLIVGLGGGSAMDVAKGINFLLTNGGRMEDYWGSGKASRPMLPSIGIPTTAGTGSEAQSYALIQHEETHHKMACGDPKAKFRAVILDPCLTTSMPRAVTAISGIDAISHSIESYVCTARNPVSQMFAKQAWQLLEQNFETVLEQPHDIEARGNMLLGAHFAGLAIEGSMLGAAHACANPLTMHYGVLHGIAVGLMMPHVIEWNAREVQDLYNHLFSGMLQERFLELRRRGGMPESLRDCRVERTSIPKLANEAAQQWTGKYNPRPLEVMDFVKLYEKAY